MSGRDFNLLIEDIQNQESLQRIQKNAFWRALMERPEEVPDSVYHGMCVENYHLLYRESYFDSPVLSYAYNHRVRAILNEFYSEELGHDRLLLKSLEFIGLDADALFDTVPLPQTMALVNALSYWARHDPLFFLTTLGPLEGRDVEVDSYVTAMQAKGMPDMFIKPVLSHAIINKEAEHGYLTREIFDEVDAVAMVDVERCVRQTRLFITLYDDFYTGIWHHYQTWDPAARRVGDAS